MHTASAPHHLVSVAINVPLFKTFRYQFSHPLAIGTRVLVPFRQKQLVGFIWDKTSEDDVEPQRIKTINKVLADIPPLPQDLCALVRFCAAYYHYPIGQVLFAAIPTLLRRAKPVTLPDLQHWALTQLGRQQAPPAIHKKAQHRLWQALHTQISMTLQEAAVLNPQAKTLFIKWNAAGWLTQTCNQAPWAKVKGLDLNTAQNNAVKAISLTQYGCYLLHGVTGSGKTEVYLHLIDKVLKQGHQVLILVPEISLTPQLLAQFAKRFPHTTTVALHSQLTDAQRFKAWYQASSNQAHIIIGARLSVFTALPKLGLIVIDEEHDPSFKQQDEVRYHARDLAIWRARQAHIPIVLCSATPSLESVLNSQLGRCHLLTLPQRAHKKACLPAIHLINIQSVPLQNGLSETVIHALKQTWQENQQSLIFINRRGLAPVIRCVSCGWIPQCKHCSTKLVLHQHQRLLCHRCGYQQVTHIVCPDCGELDLRALGQGTQSIEDTVTCLLPQATVLRVDRDTMQHQKRWHQFYEAMQKRKIDILVGTQMLTKGHDFPHIATVIVLNADHGLYAADFRSAERLFAQLIQVSGRAGRAAIPGQVFIQTAWPEHPLYKALINHDVAGFAANELTERMKANFPPFTFQALLRADAKSLSQATDFLSRVKICLHTDQNIALYGPMQAMTAKLKGRVRMQLVLEAKQRRALHQSLRIGLPQIMQLHKHYANIRWSIDVDPQEF
ncbi:MAG: primosomal protein N' [Neisseriales bacterium]|nr:MAG: primosomal protein N' [Neisseriales bacterium]